MGLFSGLFGGGKAVKAKPAGKGAGKPEAKASTKPVANAEAKPVVKVVATVAAAPGLTDLLLTYAAHDRAGAHDKAYAAACKLAGLYKASGAVALRKRFGTAAERHLLARLAQVSSDQRMAVVARLRKRLDVAPAAVAVKLAAEMGGAEAAKLLAAHSVWLKTTGLARTGRRAPTAARLAASKAGSRKAKRAA